jgi:hypothetical protein
MSRTDHRVGLALAVFALAGALAPADPQPEAPNKALTRKQLDVARQALRDLDLLYKNGDVSLYDHRFALWERRQVEAIRASGADKAEVVAALGRYVERLKSLRSTVQTAFEKEQLTRVDVHDARYRLLEAEIWLNQEKAR